MTWCGNLVRIWYVNATIYGCSQPFDTKDPKGQEAIVKILQFLSSEEHQSQLYGHWDLVAERVLNFKPGTVLRGGAPSIELTGLEELDARPGPFRARTSVFADQGEGPERTVVKFSWLARHLLMQELEISDAIYNFPADCRLPYPPEPLGLAEVPDPDFQIDNCEPLRISGPAPYHPPRTACVLVTKQHLGDVIGKQVPPQYLAHIHMELADQLLVLATHGYHDRDLNEGNIRILQGSHKTLLIIDFGNVRKNLSPRGRSGMTDAEATIDRATDDTRSANAMFLPTCCSKVAAAIKHWNSAVENATNGLQRALARGHDHRVALRRISAELGALRNAMREIATQSHRYIDDLESAVYLQFWSVSELALRPP